MTENGGMEIDKRFEGTFWGMECFLKFDYGDCCYTAFIYQKSPIEAHKCVICIIIKLNFKKKIKCYKAWNEYRTEV